MAITLNGNDFKVLQTIQSLHTIKGHPGLWMMKKQVKGTFMASFYDILDPDRVITINFQRYEPQLIDKLIIHTNGAVNQEEIDKAVEKQETPPKPVRRYQLSMRLLMMLQSGEEEIPLNEDGLKAAMEKHFPDYDQDEFKVYHMKKVWNWYSIIKKYRDSLPAPEVPKEEPKEMTAMDHVMKDAEDKVADQYVKDIESLNSDENV